MGQAEGIRSLLEPVLAAAGLELWDVEVGNHLVRVLLDAPGGIDLDALTGANRLVSPILDDHPELAPPGSYQLEVSSPGLERTLRSLDHFRRYMGTLVSVKTRVPLAGSRRHRGRLLRADEDGVELDPEGQEAGTPLRISYQEIERARTVVVWETPAAPALRRRTTAVTAASPAPASPAALDPKDT